jgi:hypothetical protein
LKVATAWSGQDHTTPAINERSMMVSAAMMVLFPAYPPIGMNGDDTDRVFDV